MVVSRNGGTPKSSTIHLGYLHLWKPLDDDPGGLKSLWKTHVAPAVQGRPCKLSAANRAQFLGISSQFLRTLVLWLVACRGVSKSYCGWCVFSGLSPVRGQEGASSSWPQQLNFLAFNKGSTLVRYELVQSFAMVFHLNSPAKHWIFMADSPWSQWILWSDVAPNMIQWIDFRWSFFIFCWDEVMLKSTFRTGDGNFHKSKESTQAEPGNESTGAQWITIFHCKRMDTSHSISPSKISH